MNTHLLLLIFSFVLFTLAAVPYPPSEPYWSRLVAAGLAFFIASILFV